MGSPWPVIACSAAGDRRRSGDRKGQGLDRGRNQSRENDPSSENLIEMPGFVWETMLTHIVRSLPAEGCGLLAFERRAATPMAVEFFAGENVDRSSTHYTMAPRDILRTLLEIDRRHLVLGAIIHSHPTTAATPSPCDLAEARYPNVLLGIVGMASLAPHLRFWRLPAVVGGDPVEVAWRLSP